MWVRKLLFAGILLALGQGLRGTALADNATHRSTHAAAHETFDSQSELAQALPQADSGSALDATSPTPNAVNPELARLTYSRLSSLILPLPPLLLPELLLPPYHFPSFNSQRLDQELQLYYQYLRTFGTPDVLIVGSSRSLQGIDPIALENALSDRGASGLKVFNFGINGATAQVIDLLLQKVLLPEHLPRLIIWGDGSRAFNNGRLDITYNGIVASAGYNQLKQGDRPIPSRQQWEALLQQTTARKVSPGSSFSADRSPRPPIAPDLTMNGFESISTRFDPTTYFRQYPQVPGRFDADYQNFQLNGVQSEATLAVAGFARQHNISLVFVNLPLTDDYLDQARLNYEQQFRQHMQQLANQGDFIFVDLSQRSALMQDHYFVDPSHINREGARAVAIELAGERLIPWASLNSPLEAEVP